MLDSGILAGGTAPQVRALEKEWARYVGAKHCLTTCSGTAALHMALAACGVGPGDEVITSAFTFLASASCALHQNAIPVFVDIDPRTYCMDPAQLEAAITERTKAIIPVHIQGCPPTWTRSSPSRRSTGFRDRGRLPGARRRPTRGRRSGRSATSGPSP